MAIAIVHASMDDHYNQNICNRKLTEVKRNGRSINNKYYDHDQGEQPYKWN